MLNIVQYKQKLLSREFNFEDFALWAFHYQYKNNDTYQKFCDYMGAKPKSITQLTDIPFMPISFFKNHLVTCTPQKSAIKTFESSGTTGTQTSKHHIYDLDFYLENAEKLFLEHYSDIKNTVFLFLLPSYLERSNSSLVYMANHFVERANHSHSGFYLDNYQELSKKLKELHENNTQDIFLFGVTFGLLDFAEYLNKQKTHFKVTVMETGGMKGRRKELTRSEVHEILREPFCSPQVHSEYGMTELLSQCYSYGNGIFKESATLRVLIRELQDPLNIQLNGTGGINLIDLANIDSCCFLATDDQGKKQQDQFEILGRVDHSDIRGCNLMTV